ncbi:MAG: TfoX/Sxy family protein [Candidatus Binatia bacterium]
MTKGKKAFASIKSVRSPQPPPLHQGTLDESVARLELRGVSVKRMFGGLCYYAEGNPFAFLLGSSLALKLPAAQLRQGCGQGDGELFHPGGGDFVMREYLDLGESVLMDEGRVDAYVRASYRFMVGQGTAQEDLEGKDLLQGREALYKQTKQKKG